MSTFQPHNRDIHRASGKPVRPAVSPLQKAKKRPEKLRWLIAPPKRKPLFETALPQPIEKRPPKPNLNPSLLRSDPASAAHRNTSKLSQRTASTALPCQTTKLAQVIDRKVNARRTRHQIKSKSLGQLYFAETRRPIVALYFVLPLIVIYEIAKIFIGLQTACSGIDYWVYQILNAFGVGQLVILPLLTAALLLAWHHRRNDHYSFDPKLLPLMALEAMSMGLMLFLFANIYQMLSTTDPNAGAVADPYLWTIGSPTWWSNVITFIGTGIHEELIFRVLLMLPMMLALQPIFAGQTTKGQKIQDRTKAVLVAASVSSLLFAVAHVNWLNPAGEPFNEVTFVFRLVAAGIFSGLFFYRGFAIVVGTHITYNVLTLIST